MKKLVLFAVAVVFAGMVNAQDCTALIDGSANVVGLNPNPPEGSIAGVPYNEVNTLVIPGRVNNTQTPDPIDSIQLCAVGILAVNGMPSGYTYDVWAFTGGPGTQYDVLAIPGTDHDTIHVFQTVPVTRVCIRMKNPTPPMSSNSGDGMPFKDSVAIQVIVGAWIEAAGCLDFSGLGAKDTFEFKLCIRDSLYIGIDEETNNAFKVGNNNPNPANEVTYLNFTTPSAGDVTINLFDAVGRNVRNFKIGSTPGANTYPLSTSDLRSGVYMYNVTYNGKTISKKLIVNR